MEEMEQIIEETKNEPTIEEKAPKQKALSIVLNDNDASILLEALDKYIANLKDTKRAVNKIVENIELNKSIDAKIKTADNLRFLVNKDLIIVDKSKKIYTTVEEGKVLETSIDNPVIIGNTPKVKVSPVKPAETKVLQVIEE